MYNRKRPVCIGARVTPAEKLLVQAAAVAEGVSVAEFLHRVVVPSARERMLCELEGGSVAGATSEQADGGV